MRILTQKEQDKLKLLTENSVEYTLIEPTRTGLGKSIMDATVPVRTYLKEKNIHDFSLQLQGQKHKVKLRAKLIAASSTIDTTVALYRPDAKKGDPRIWFYGLKKYAEPNDILGVFVFESILYVINITQLKIKKLIEGLQDNPLKELVEEINRDSTAIANELLGMLKKVAEMGKVPALLQADTAVGRTLEHLLGISINSSKKPDYKGIELKSFRQARGNRKTLFAQVPNWKLSKFKSSSEIIHAFGYDRGEDLKLYCTVSAISRNPQGLKLKLDDIIGHLIENSNATGIGDFAVWELEQLHSSLLNKHNETFWIAAESHVVDGKEYFQYKKVEHTRKPIVSQFDLLLDQGLITLDHLIKKNAKGRVSEKGPLFKIKPSALNLLFPPSKIYDLI